MTILTASIEANGWVLALTLNASLGSFTSYELDPDGTPRLTLSSTHAGYSPVGGVAAADVKTRTLVGTKPLRKPALVIGNTLQPAVIDETELGGGQIAVRIALSQFVYASDLAPILLVLADWRTGEGAATIAVTNGSTVVAPVPIFRWLDVPYQRNINGQITLTLMAFSHHPSGVAPVAAVKFTVTDGTNVKTGWATALSSSTTYGDNTRAYAVTIDVTGAPALTAGLLRCDAEVYPWIGAMRPTDIAGTKSMAALGTEAFKTPAATPFTVAYDPAGTRYGGFVAIDPAGSGSASAVTVGTTWAAAKAGTPAATLAVAVQAGYLANRSLPAANGQTAKARSVDGMSFGFVAGTHAAPGNTSVTSGITADECWPNLIGDPDDVDPRANCILQTGSSSIAPRISRWRIANMTLAVGGTSLVLSAPTYWWYDNAEIRGKAGFEAATTGITSVTPAAGFASLFATRSRLWKYGQSAGWKYNGSGTRPLLIRGCETTRRMEAACIISNRWIEYLDPGVTAATADQCTAAWNSGSPIGDIGPVEDFIVAGNDLRSSNHKAWAAGQATAAAAGTSLISIRRNVFAGNLVERKTATTGYNFWAAGENETLEISYRIIEGNTTVGDRNNFGYNDPNVTTLADTNTKNNLAYVNRQANNAHDWAPIKTDDFNDPESSGLRGGTHGYRPQCTGTWSVLYGVGFDGNYDFGRHPGATNFRFEYFGTNSVQTIGGNPGYTADNSVYGIATGQGNYQPANGSPLMARGRSANIDRDIFGAVRAVPFAAGAVEYDNGVALAPTGARHLSGVGATTVGWDAMLLADSARSVGSALDAVVAWFGALAPDTATATMTTSAAGLAWSAVLAPDFSLLSTGGTAPALAELWALAPDSALHAVTDTGVVPIPESVAALIRTLLVSGELRIVHVPAS